MFNRHNNKNKITNESKIEDVMMRLGVGEGQELRDDPRRETTLRQFAQLRSRNPQTKLKIKDVPTAFVKSKTEDGGSFTDITIPNKKYEQTITNLPEKYHDYIIQRALTAHEVGHILYSSYQAFKKYLDKVEEEEKKKEVITKSEAKQYQKMFSRLYNVIEDGAVETYLGEDFRLEEDIIHTRATIHEGQYLGSVYPIENRTEYHYPFFFAVQAACLNLGVYDNKELDKLLDDDNDEFLFAKRGREKDRMMFEDEALPLIKKSIPDIQAEKDAQVRSKKIHELWLEIREFIDKATTSGREEMEIENKTKEGDGYAEGVPDNLSDGHGDQKSESSGSESGGSEDGEEMPGKMKGDRARNSHGFEGEVEDKAKQYVLNEAKREGGDWSEELENIINSLGGEGVEEIYVAEDGDVDHERMNKAKNNSQKAKRLFARRLRQVNKDKTIKNKYRGEFDSGNMINAARGSTRCFKQKREGTEKNYSCMIVLDRSGSMSGSVENVELVAGSIAWGLQDIGVDTCILDTENSQTTLSKPFGADVENFKEKLFAGRYGGGTPITGTLKFARRRMERGEGKFPFMIVITDGGAHNKSAFKEQVRKANFPVLGFYLSNSREGVKDQLSLYNRAVVAKNSDELNQKMINLIKRIAF